MAQIPCCCGVGSGVAMAVALIRLLVWEFPYATGTALKKKKILTTQAISDNPKLGQSISSS